MKKHKIIPAIFMAIIIAFGLLYFIVPDKEISADENRTLAKLPKLSTKSVLSGDFTAALNDYMNDQFPLRDSFINAGNTVQSMLALRGSEVEMVVSTGNMDMGEGETLAEIPVAEEEKKPEPAKLELADEADYNNRGIIIVGDRAMELFGFDYNMMQRYAALVNSVKKALPGVNVYSLLLPTSVEFYSPVQYHEGRRSQKAAIEVFNSMLMPGVTPVDAYTYLAAYADRYIYFRTDHHWTVRGAYQGYYAFCEAAGLKPVEEDSFEAYQVEGGFLGTLYRYTRRQTLADNPDYVEVLTPPEIESCEAYTDASMRNSYSTSVIVDPGSSSNKYLAFLGGDNPLLHIVTKNNNGRRVLIIKDSFGNAFTPFLINHYEEVYAADIRSSGIKLTEFCAEHQIDDVIVENYLFAISNSEILEGLRSSAQ